MNNLKIILHKDGTVSYWSVYLQSRISHAWKVPDRELAAMNEDERARAVRHLEKIF